MLHYGDMVMSLYVSVTLKFKSVQCLNFKSIVEMKNAPIGSKIKIMFSKVPW